MIIPEIVHHFFSKVIKGIEQVANKRGYNVIIGLSNESFDKEVINMQLLANGSIDGFILSISKETLLKQDYHHFTESIDQGMPIVMFDRVVNDIKCDKVVVDDYEGSRKAVEMLISKGCKNIALITTKDYVSVGRLRTKGYLEALDLNKIAANSEFILKVDDNDVSDDHLESLESDIEKLLKQNKVDGIFAVNEIYAITAMKVARKLKLKIPENIKIIGFTDGVLSKHASPSLTTVSQHAIKMGEISAKLIIDKLESKETNENNQLIIIPTEIIERESTI